MELPKKKNSRKRNSTSSETGLPTKKKYYCRKKKKNISSEETKMTTMMHVSKDDMFEILSKLPAKYLLRLRWVCKYWFTLITNPDFVKMHLNNVNATDNPPLVLIKSVKFHCLKSMNDALVNMKAPLQFTSSRSVKPRILGSCNGLLCIGCYSRGYAPIIFIWNPCTKQYKMIWGFDSTIRTLSSGFGYDCSIDDYKVIRIVRSFKDNVSETLIDVHTLGTSSSKELRDNRFYFGGKNGGVYINGFIYWKASLTGSIPLNIIVAFDVAKEEYRQITSKPYINNDKSRSMHLGKLNGCLCVVKVTANCRKSMEVWVMNHNADDDIKKEYSWDILYTISTSHPMGDFVYIKPLKFCRNGEFVMVMDKDLISYDPKSKQIRLLPMPRGMVMIETYIESLVPVKGDTYIDGPPSIATDKPTIDGLSSIAKGKRKREVKIEATLDGLCLIFNGYIIENFL